MKKLLWFTLLIPLLSIPFFLADASYVQGPAQLTVVSGTLAVVNGGTGAITAPAALTNLGAAPTASPTFTGLVTAAATNAVGATDTIQLLAKGNGTQTSNIFEVQKSDATKLIQVNNSGNLGINGTPNITTSSGTWLTLVSASSSSNIELQRSTPVTGAGTNLGSFRAYNGTTGVAAILFQSDNDGHSDAGQMLFQTALNGSLSSKLTISTTGAITMPSLAATSAAQTGTVCWATGGNLTVDTTLACLSSIRKIKENIKPLDIGIREVMKLSPVSYNLKKEFNPNHLKEQVGLIADDVALVDDRLVGRGTNGELLGVRYMQLTAVLVKSIQEQQKEIQELKNQVRELSGR